MAEGWPQWWDWELDLTPHLLKRMVDRGFSEIDLRTMLGKATGRREGTVEGRWLVETRNRGRPWEVVVEPDFEMQLLVVITAYAVG